MKRTLSIPLYFLALAITLLVFAIGVYIGTAIDTANLDSIQRNLDEVGSGVSSLEFLLLSEDPQFFCPVYLDELNRINTDIERIGQRLTLLEEEKGIVDAELKRRFFLLEMNSYLLSQRVNTQCTQNITLIMYFYSNQACAECARQGVELTESRRQAGDVHTYAFDGDLGSPIVTALKDKYNVTSYPTIVIDDRVFEGFVDASRLRAEIG